MAISNVWGGIKGTARAMPRSSSSIADILGRGAETFAAQKRLLPKTFGGGAAYTPSPAMVQASQLLEDYKNNLAKDYAASAGSEDVYTGPYFSEEMPFYKSWEEKFLPQAQAVAAQEVTPEVMRNYLQTYRDYMGGMASSGGGRFGQGWGGTGGLAAGAERGRKQLMDQYVNQLRQGYKGLFYDPTAEAWNLRATQLGKRPEMPTVPTWEDMYKQVQGKEAPTGATNYTWGQSPFLGQIRG